MLDKFLPSYVNLEELKEVYHIIACWIPTLLWMPITITVINAFRMYKFWIGYKLKRDKSSGFKAFLSGEDVLFAMENPITKFIVNVVAFVPDQDQEDGNMPDNILRALRERFHSSLMVDRPFPKMFYLRKEYKGYYYWTEDNPLTVNDYIRFLDTNPNNSENKEETISEKKFCKKLSEICYQPLPANNRSEFEMLVGRQAVQTADGRKYPIIFRVHHTLGDGIAIVRLLLEALCDKDNNEFSKTLKSSEKPRSFLEKLFNWIQDLLDNIFSEEFRVFVTHLLLSPSVLYKLDAREVDNNGLHPSELCGRKIVGWYQEPQSDLSKSMISQIKSIKGAVPNSRFTNILLAALSKSMTKYMKSRSMEVPDQISLVTPSRIYSKEKDQFELSNQFSVGYRTLLMNENLGGKFEKYSKILTNKPDYHINYWMMTSVASVFPEKHLAPLMVSKHCTMAVSNIPGPRFTVKISGFELKTISFFLPNMGQTGLAVSILSYDGRLSLGILADENVVPNEEDLEEILQEMVMEIEAMAGDLSH